MAGLVVTFGRSICSCSENKSAEEQMCWVCLGLGRGQHPRMPQLAANAAVLLLKSGVVVCFFSIPVVWCIGLTEV